VLTLRVRFAIINPTEAKHHLGRNQMNTQEKAIYAQMVAKATSLPADELKRVILEDNTNPKLPEVVFNSLLDALEKLISEEEFIKFCEEM
jgi:hypothetical protein